MKNKNSELEWNVRTHDRLARDYEKNHGEIYNEIEQNRLRVALSNAISEIKTNSTEKIVLDYGCGAGNLTSHLSSLGCTVMAADVSGGFLDLISSKVFEQSVKTIKLNGKDLSNIPSESFDMVATYSVLHHVPDYLAIIPEFNRIIKPGGIIFIDHEPSEEFWQKNEMYIEFTNKIKRKMPVNIKKYLVLRNYYDWVIRKFINPRYHREGDIHVFDDDHVEWKKIIKILDKEGAEVVFSKSYLLYRRGYDKSIYTNYKDKITDMHMLVMRKLNERT
jgi:2-polyprenyl-3-methyl-5-hydroxy-6-metoxy-1,4-benzoquinol methylase